MGLLRCKIRDMWRTLLAVWLATVCSLFAAPVRIHGYITDIQSPKAFAIDDYKITADDHLEFAVDKGDYADAAFQLQDLRIGSELEVQGDFNDSTHELHATSIKVFISDNVRVKRTAVIENTAVLARDGITCKGLIHADGQTIRVDADTRVLLRPMEGMQLNPGMSIAYEGERDRDGSIHASRLEILPGKGEKSQWFVERAPKVNSDGEIPIRGVRYKLVPDAEAQSYVQRIGTQLVPSYYVKDLAGGAARKNPFQFYVVANDDFNAHAFPDGTVLVNAGLFRVLTSEAQLAAVLGHEIAHATQEHAVREQQLEKRKGDKETAERSYTGGGKGDPSSVRYARILENQADRLGLQYMAAAGYDPREAPEVWKQVERAAGHKAGIWDGQDNVTARRSYLLAELRNSYSGVDFGTYARDREEFDRLAERFGNTSIVHHGADTALSASLADPPVKRPGYVPPSQPVVKHYGANAVNILSDPEGADVVIDGHVVGKTPMVLPTGNPGLPYTVTVRRAGYRIWTAQMVSVPGRTSLQVDLIAAQ